MNNYCIAVLFLLLTLFLTRWTDKCLIHPVTVTSSVWIFLLVGYNVIDHGLYSLSDKFYAAFLAWMIPFQMCSYVVCTLVNNDKHPLHPAMPLVTNRYVVFFVAFCTISAIALNYSMIMKIGSGLNFSAEMREQITGIVRGELPPPPIWVRFFSSIANIGYLMVLLYYMKGIKIKYQFLFVSLIWIWILMGANKAAVLRLIFGYVGILAFNKKLNIHRLLYFMLIACLIAIIIQVVRDDVVEMDFQKFLYFAKIYLFSPLTAFDHYILHSNTDFIVYFNGEFVFKDFSLLGSLFSDDYDKTNVNFFNNELVYVPWGTNVYTMMSGYWAGWKWVGLIVGGGIHGCFWGYIYKRAKNAEVYKLCYSALLYVLVFQFFSDYLISKSTLFTFIYPFLFFFRSIFSIRRNRNLNHVRL